MNDTQLMKRYSNTMHEAGDLMQEEVIRYAFRNTGIELSDFVTEAASNVPLVHENGDIYYEHSSLGLAHCIVTDFIARAGRIPMKKIYRPIYAEVKRLGYHLVNYAEHKGAVYFRLFRTSDFPCIEHPEMFLGKPIGQYHCPHCGTMVCAGAPHGDKDE